MANRLTMDIITKIISEKKLFWISFAIIGYFCLLYLNAYFAKSDLVFIGWIQELLTIPFILFQFILLIISILYCIKDTFRVNRYSFGSFFILLTNNLFVICSPLIPQHYYKIFFLSTWATKSCSGFCHVRGFT